MPKIRIFSALVAIAFLSGCACCSTYREVNVKLATPPATAKDAAGRSVSVALPNDQAVNEALDVIDAAMKAHGLTAQTLPPKSNSDLKRVYTNKAGKPEAHCSVFYRPKAGKVEVSVVVPWFSKEWDNYTLVYKDVYMRLVDKYDDRRAGNERYWDAMMYQWPFDKP